MVAEKNQGLSAKGKNAFRFASLLDSFRFAFGFFRFASLLDFFASLFFAIFRFQIFYNIKRPKRSNFGNCSSRCIFFIILRPHSRVQCNCTSAVQCSRCSAVSPWSTVFWCSFFLHWKPALKKKNCTKNFGGVGRKSNMAAPGPKKSRPSFPSTLLPRKTALVPRLFNVHCFMFHSSGVV